MGLADAPELPVGDPLRRKRPPSSDGLQLLHQCSLVRVREEKPGETVLHGLGEPAGGARDDGHTANERLDSDQPERLGMQRGRHESPGPRELMIQLLRSNPAPKAHRVLHGQIRCELLERASLGACTNEMQARRRRTLEQASERSEQQWDALLRTQPPAEDEERMIRGCPLEPGTGKTDG